MKSGLKLKGALALLAFSQALQAQDSPRRAEFTFNPLQVKRDPFSPPDFKASEVVDELRRFDLLEMKLVAIMTGLGAPKAMLVLPNGKSHIVQENDRLGRNRGYVMKISPKEVTVVESFKDFRGREKKSYEKLTLEK